MKITQSPSFARSIKKLHSNQKKSLDRAVKTSIATLSAVSSKTPHAHLSVSTEKESSYFTHSGGTTSLNKTFARGQLKALMVNDDYQNVRRSTHG